MRFRSRVVVTVFLAVALFGCGNESRSQVVDRNTADEPRYQKVEHGNHAHYYPSDRDPDVPLSEFPTRPPGPGERITPEGQIVEAEVSQETLEKISSTVRRIILDVVKLRGLSESGVSSEMRRRLVQRGAIHGTLEPSGRKRRLYGFEEDNQTPSVSFSNAGKSNYSENKDIYIWSEEAVSLWLDRTSSREWTIVISDCEGSSTSSYLVNRFEISGSEISLEDAERNVVVTDWSDEDLINSQNRVEAAVANFNTQVGRFEHVAGIVIERSESEGVDNPSLTELKQRLAGNEELAPGDLTRENGLENYMARYGGLFDLSSDLSSHPINDTAERVLDSETYKQIMAQIEGTINRIAVARRDLNEAVTDFNTGIFSFIPVDCSKLREEAQSTSSEEVTQTRADRPSGAPSSEVIKVAITDYWDANKGNLTIEGCGRVCRQRELSQIEIIKRGLKQQESSSNTYWPVRVKMEGRCGRQVATGCGWTSFESNAEFDVYRNDFGEWEADLRF